MIVVSGSSNPLLAQQVAKLLGATIADVHLSKFPNGEKRIWIKTPLKNETVVLIQSFSEPVDEHIIELSLLADAAKQLHAKKIIAVIPWMGYSPQDKSFREGEPISIQVISKIIEGVGVTDIFTVDIHSQASLDFFNIPISELTALPLFVEYLKREEDLDNSVVVQIDKGSQRRSEEFAEILGLPLCVFSKQRDRFSGDIKFEHISGEFKGKTGISFDDFISTGSTQIGACEYLKSQGLSRYIACVTHAVFAGTNTSHKLQDSQIDQILTTDSYAVNPAKNFLKLEQLPLAPVLVEALQ